MTAQPSVKVMTTKPPVPKNKPTLFSSRSVDPNYARVGETLKSHACLKGSRSTDVSRASGYGLNHERNVSSDSPKSTGEAIYAVVNKRRCKTTNDLSGTASQHLQETKYSVDAKGLGNLRQRQGDDADTLMAMPIDQTPIQSPSTVSAQIAFFESLDETSPKSKLECTSSKAKTTVPHHSQHWNNTGVSGATYPGYPEVEAKERNQNPRTPNHEGCVDGTDAAGNLEKESSTSKSRKSLQESSSNEILAIPENKMSNNAPIPHGNGPNKPKMDNTKVSSTRVREESTNRIDSIEQGLANYVTVDGSVPPGLSFEGNTSEAFEDDLEPYATSRRRKFSPSSGSLVDTGEGNGDHDPPDHELSSEKSSPGHLNTNKELYITEKTCGDELAPCAASGKKHIATECEEEGTGASGEEAFYIDETEPYAVSRKRGAIYSAEDENPYEDVDFKEKWTHTTLVDKHIYDYICAYEKLEETELYVDPDVDDASRDIVIGFGSEQDFNSFNKLYENVKSELWVEGIKSSSVKDINSLWDQLQSKYRCICSRPNEEDVEIVCRREDIDKIKRTIEENVGSTVHFLYERAKSMETEELEPIVTIVDFEPTGYSINGNKVYIHIADITDLKVSAIVNAANGYFNNGSGVARAIARAAGRRWENNCKDYVKSHGMISVTEVIKMESGDLPCEAVLNAVGPRWPKRAEKQAKCKDEVRATFGNILLNVEEYKLTSVAIPPISSGKFKVPHEIVSSALVATLLNTPKMESCSSVHIVDVRDDVLSLIRQDIEARMRKETGASNRIQPLNDDEVLATIAAVKCDSATGKKFGNRLKVLFKKTQ